MDNAKKHYWGVLKGQEVLYSGTFNDCWKYLVGEFYEYEMKELEAAKIRIARI